MSILRPACLSDVRFEWIERPMKPQWVSWSWVSHGVEYNAAQHGALKTLYDAEWQKRGYKASP